MLLSSDESTRRKIPGKRQQYDCCSYKTEQYTADSNRIVNWLKYAAILCHLSETDKCFPRITYGENVKLHRCMTSKNVAFTFFVMT
jgi:hypothetical protein